MATAPERGPDTPEAWVAAARRGDREAWDALVTRLAPRISWRARTFARRGLDREDVVQEGYIGLVHAVRTFREGRQGFMAYADICVTRAMARAVRAPVPPLAELLADVPDDGDARWGRHLLSADLAPDESLIEATWLVDWAAERVGQCLRDDERLALLAAVHGIAYSAVAQHLVRSEGVVGRLVMRARRKLRAVADHEGIG